MATLLYDRPVSAPGSAPLSPDDVGRVAEFFDGNLQEAYGFVNSVWLPDAAASIARLVIALRSFDLHDVVFLCDHLREGARTVGARVFMAHVKTIECTVREGDWVLGRRLTAELEQYLGTIRHWIDRRFDDFSIAAAAYRRTQNLVN